MKKILLISLCLMFCLSVSALAEAGVEYSDASFDKVYPSYSDVVIVENNGKIGAVDRLGNTVVDFGDYSAVLPDSKGNFVMTTATSDSVTSRVYNKSGKILMTINGGTVVSVADGIVTVISDVKADSSGAVVYTVRYLELPSGKQLLYRDNVVSCTPFSEGYAAIQLLDKTVVVDLSGEVIYEDDKRLEPLASCGDGLIPFRAEDDDFYIAHYIVDLNKKERICLGEFQLDSNTNFKKVMAPFKNFESFYLQTDEDNRSVLSYNGTYFCVTENPVNYNLDYVAVTGGVNSAPIDLFSSYNAGEKYVMSDNLVEPFYVSVKDGKIVDCDYEAVTAFADGKAVVFSDTDEFVFVDESFNVISESFDDAFWVYSFGDVFAIKDSKGEYRFAWISDGTTTKPTTPTTPTTPTKPSTPTTPSTPVTPKPVSGMKNFVKTEAYTDSVYPDVKKSDWFRANVALAYETGLMKGKENGFAPQDKLTLAQVITMAARLHSIYNTGKADFVQGKVWYEVYVDYCTKNGIVGKNDFSNLNRNATRAEFVRILSKAIPKAEFDAKNVVNSIPDVAASHKDASSVFMFYRAGILAGSDSRHSFFPDSDITRAETAAIITRIIDKSLRLSF